MSAAAPAPPAALPVGRWLHALGARGRGLLAVAAGGLQVAAYAPLDQPWCALLSPCLLLLLWRDAAPREALGTGLLFGLGQFGFGVYWIYYSLHLFGDAIAPLAALLTGGFVFGMALYPALLGYLLCRAPRRGGAAWMLLLAPAGWVLAEWLRGWFLTGFPWLLLGYSQTDWPLAGYLPLVGAYGASLVLAFSAGTAAWLLSMPAPRLRQGLVLLLCLLLWGGGQALRPLHWSEPLGEPIRLRLVQGNVEQHVKFLAELLQPSIDLYSEASLAPHRADVVIWPETAIPTFYHRVEQVLAPVAAALRERGVDLAIGVLEYRQADSRYFNAVRKLTAPAEAPELYLKSHLVPFGEYMPLRGLLQFLSRFILIPMSDISSGPAVQAPLRLGGARAAVSICYEDAFGAEIIRQLPAANFLLNVSNDAWFGDSLAPHQHLQIARVRALETARPMARATNTGITALIDYDGRILARSPQFAVHVLDGAIQPRSGATPYVQFGNWPVLIVLTLMLGAALALARNRKPS